MTDWRHRAACRGHDNPELWFPLDEERPDALALAICAGCPVQAECLAFALDHGLDFGVFGGLTRGERRELHRPARPRKVRAPRPRARRPVTGSHCLRGPDGRFIPATVKEEESA
jgi:WhiB family redox-sensing transcriptional regulator